MASRRMVKLLFRALGRSSGKPLPEAEGRGQQFPMDSPHTEGQQNDCTPRSHGIGEYCQMSAVDNYSVTGKQFDRIMIQETRIKTRKTDRNNKLRYIY